MNRYQAREIVLIDSDLSRGARLLYLILDNHQRLRPDCFPSQKLLAEEMGCDVRTVQRHLSRLIKSDLCSPYRVRPGGPNHYALFHTEENPVDFVENQGDHTTELSPPHDRIVGTLTTELSPHGNREVKPEIQTERFREIPQLNTPVENPPESKPLPLNEEPQKQKQKLPCHACKGSGSILIPTGYAKCGQCNGTGNSSYRSAAAIERREKYLQTARGGFERSRQLAAEGFHPLSRSPALQRALEPEFGASREQVAECLRNYPRAGALRGTPDAEIVSRTMSAAGNWEALKSAVRAMNEARATPTQSWGWFPAVVGRYCRRKAA